MHLLKTTAFFLLIMLAAKSTIASTIITCEIKKNNCSIDKRICNKIYDINESNKTIKNLTFGSLNTETYDATEWDDVSIKFIESGLSMGALSINLNYKIFLLNDINRITGEYTIEEIYKNEDGSDMPKSLLEKLISSTVNDGFFRVYPPSKYNGRCQIKKKLF